MTGTPGREGSVSSSRGRVLNLFRDLARGFTAQGERLDERGYGGSTWSMHHLSDASGGFSSNDETPDGSPLSDTSGYVAPADPPRRQLAGYLSGDRASLWTRNRNGQDGTEDGRWGEDQSNPDFMNPEEEW